MYETIYEVWYYELNENHSFTWIQKVCLFLKEIIEWEIGIVVLYATVMQCEGLLKMSDD